MSFSRDCSWILQIIDVNVLWAEHLVTELRKSNICEHDVLAGLFFSVMTFCKFQLFGRVIAFHWQKLTITFYLLFFTVDEKLKFFHDFTLFFAWICWKKLDSETYTFVWMDNHFVVFFSWNETFIFDRNQESVKSLFTDIRNDDLVLNFILFFVWIKGKGQLPCG